jgi:hypothetical protein
MTRVPSVPSEFGDFFAFAGFAAYSSKESIFETGQSVAVRLKIGYPSPPLSD